MSNTFRVDKILRLYRSGESVSDIARAIGHHTSYVSRALSRAMPDAEREAIRVAAGRRGAARALPIADPADDAEIVRMRREYLSIEEIASRTGRRAYLVRERLATLLPPGERLEIRGEVERRRLAGERTPEPTGAEYEAMKRQIREEAIAATRGPSVRRARKDQRREGVRA